VSLKKPIAALLFAVSALSALAQAQPIKPFEPASLERIAASHRGKPFLLLVWSMDCEFCQASLEVMAKARSAHPTLNIVTVTTDPIADPGLSEQVRARLASLRLLDDAWSYANAPPERLRFALDPAWRGEKPRSYWYDATGKRSAYSGLIKAAKLAQWHRAQAKLPGGERRR
jgi:hypothetical protein